MAKEEPREGEQSASHKVRERHEGSPRAQDQCQETAPAPETCGYILSRRDGTNRLASPSAYGAE